MYTTRKLIEDFGIKLPESKLHMDQRKIFERMVIHDGQTATLKVEIRYGDDCKNGHNTFAITGDLYQNGEYVTGGCIHDIISKNVPELRKYIKWHLVSTDGPLYYVENSRYHAENGDIDAARETTVWPEATVEDIMDNEKMAKHLAEIMPQFKHDVEELGFTY